MNTSSKPFRAFLTGLGAVLASGWVSTALAVPPLKGNFGPDEVVGDFVGDCGTFDVLLDFTIEGFFLLHFDQDSNLVAANQHINFPNDRYYNSENPGIQLKGNAVENQHFDLVDNVVAVSGLSFKLTVPGHGVVFHEAGHVVIDLSNGDVLFQAGPSDLTGGDLAALCAALTP